jgi:dTMP kinase
MSKLIVIEGADGVGKTAQAHLLREHLASIGHDAVLTGQPSTGTIGKLICASWLDQINEDNAPDDVLALLFAADRIDHMARVVKPALNRGATVVSARWYHSSLAYQGLASEERWSWVRGLNQAVRVPDLTVILHADNGTAEARRDQRDQLLVSRWVDRADFQGRVAQRYVHTASQLIAAGERVELISSDGTIGHVHQRIVRAVESMLHAEPPNQISVNGMVDSRNPDVRLMGIATRQDDGSYKAIAQVGDALCVVQVQLKLLMTS